MTISGGKTLKTIGIIGGLSWTSTQRYYQLINQSINARLGREASAEIILRSINFQPIIDLQVASDWESANQILAVAGKDLENGGADFFLIASNTMHLAFEAVSSATSIKGLDIFEAVANALHTEGINTIGLLGTRYTMSMNFFKDAYLKYGIKAVTPVRDDAQKVNRIIFKELIHNRTTPASRTIVDQAIERLVAAGAQAIVLGCTELELLYPEGQQSSTSEKGWFESPPGIKIFDSTRIHAAAAATLALDSNGTRHI